MGASQFAVLQSTTSGPEVLHLPPWVIAAAVALSLCNVATQRAALAQNAERIASDPPTARILRTNPEIRTLSAAPGPLGAPSPAGEAFVELNIRYSDATIYNPGTDQYDHVRLRSYRDVREIAPPKVPFVAPTVEIFPGETVRITLNNNLPAEPNCAPPGHGVNTPNCFNRTNLHSHGIWVSPTGNSDNVLLSINPTVSFQYEYNIPPDHPAGTFWYHPHRHGSTALQVSSGMAGVMLVRGTRLPTPQSTGDVDTLLKHPAGTAFRERVVLLQQVQYACRDSNGAIKTQKDGSGNVVAWICDPGDVGEISGYDQFGPPTWKQSGRYTSINGEVLPTFAGARAGRIERWRVVHAGVRDTVNLQFKKMRSDAEAYARIAAATPQEQDWISRNCPGGTLLPQFAIASDGLTRGRLAERTTTTLQPGYREDVLMVFPEAGSYCVLDGAAAAVSTVNNQVKSRRYLGRVVVEAGEPVTDPKSYVQAQLIAAAERFMPAAVRQKVREDLADGLGLKSFVPHPDIGDGEVKPPQREARFEIGAGGFTINGQSYDPNRIDQTLPLGGVEEWKLSTVNAFGHPFHIHVNPFQIVGIIDNATNLDVSVTGDANEPQYANLKGVWKDTLFVRQGYTAYVRTRYQRYIGDFVLHCHILDHEDQGMMQNIRIALPDGSGGVAAFGHH
jgi:L-ascorbate oxidase